MTIEHMIEEKIEQEGEWLDDLIASHIRNIENDLEYPPYPGEISRYRERLARWRQEKLDKLEAELRAAANRLN